MNAAFHLASGLARIATTTTGQGSPVVFLHANVCDSRMWDAQIEAVAAAGHLAIAYDRRGFGRTIAEPEDHSSMADLLTVLEDTAQGQPAILVGCSLGGRIALDAALRHPTLVAALVLVAPSVSGAPEPIHPPGITALLAELQQAEAGDDIDRVNTLKARLWLDGPLAPAGRVGGRTRDLFLAMNGTALRAAPVGRDVDVPAIHHRLPGIAAPCIVLWGDLDFPHVQARARHIAQVVPQAIGQVMPGAAHLPGLEQPEEVTGHILAFIARVAAMPWVPPQRA